MAKKALNGKFLSIFHYFEGGPAPGPTNMTRVLHSTVLSFYGFKMHNFESIFHKYFRGGMPPTPLVYLRRFASLRSASIPIPPTKKSWLHP